MSTLKNDFPEAFDYLDQVEKNINDKIISLNTIEEAKIPLNIPNDEDLDSLILNLKQKPYNDRNQYISEYINNLNFNINDTNEKYSTFSDSSKKEQLKKLNQKLEKINRIKINPAILYQITQDINRKKNLNTANEA